jgi:hypothetical protein
VDACRLHFLTWGNHHATNDFVHVPNVVLAGTLFYPPSLYDALGRAAADYPASEGSLGSDRRRKIELAEHHHLVLQALCRGAVRKCSGDTCHPCDAYIIASATSSIPGTLKRAFPGCHVLPWEPIEPILTGKVKDASDFVNAWFSNGNREPLLFKTVQKRMGIKHAGNFKKNVRDHPDFQGFIRRRGLCEGGSGKRMTHFEYMFGPLAVEDETDEQSGLASFRRPSA